MTASGHATYLYCVVRPRRTPSLGRCPRGLPGTAPPHTIDLGEGLWVVAADAPLARYGSEAIDRGLGDLEWVSACAVAHEAVVEHVAGLGTVIPMKLFTLFASDERAVAHLRRQRPALERTLSRLAGRDEWGVRVSLVETTRRRRPATARRDGSRSGTRYLERKSAQRAAVREARERAPARMREVFESLARHADDTRQRPPASEARATPLLLDAAFLVPSRRRAGFEAAVRRLVTRLADDGYRLVVTGPWPAYNFVNEER